MDRLPNVLLWAGIMCFVFAFLLSGLYPWLITDAREPEASIVEVARGVTPEFRQLKEQYPVAFAKAFPEGKDSLTQQELANLPEADPRRAQSEEAWQAAHAKALRQGRDIYIAEACWHCHSQYVRPVANEAARFGPVQTAAHDNNALQRPVLWGTRRVGPDLTHEGGLRSNDWHAAHLLDPRSTTPDSIMPRYTWFFESGFQIRRKINPETASREGLSEDFSFATPGIHATKKEAEAALERLMASLPQNLEEEKERYFISEGKAPNGDGLALIAYLQWLGTWDPATRKVTAR